MARSIPLTRGFVALVDDADFGWLNQWKWQAHVKREGLVYAMRDERRADGTRRRVRMHRAILDVPEGLFPDHIDGDGLNNQRANLRVCTHRDNCRNRRSRSTTSTFKGVGWDKAAQRWEANIGNGLGRTRRIGRYRTEEEAARAYDAAAREIHGEFARLNFPAEAA